MKKILLTGFEPFQKEAINPSQLLVQSYLSSSTLDTLILPVSYKRSFDLLRSQLAESNYDFIFMLGQAGGRKMVELERVAINYQDSENPDEDGDLRVQHKISLEGPEAFISPLPLRDWVQTLQAKSLPVAISLSAGAFVCNSIYYQVCELIKNSRKETQALFIHLPYIQEQMLGKAEGTPFLPMPMIRKTLDEILGLAQKTDLHP